MPVTPTTPPAPHGSFVGYESGCRSNGGCPNHRSPRYLTCAEAATARRSDYAVSRLPPEAPVPRQPIVPPRTRGNTPTPKSAQQPRTTSPRVKKPLVHGTATGYLKGCRSRDECPGNDDGVTCNQARNRSRLRRARSLGIGPRPVAVSAEPAAERLIRLWESGMSFREISRVTQVGHTTITNIARRNTTVIFPETLEQILSATSNGARRAS